LRHWRDFAATKAAAAYHKIAQAIQQAVVNVVFRDRGHDSSPNKNVIFGIRGRVWPVNARIIIEIVNQSWFLL